MAPNPVAASPSREERVSGLWARRGAVFLSSLVLSVSFLGCDESESVRDLVLAFQHAEDEVCPRAGALLRERRGDPALGFYFGGYCWPEDTPWAHCVPFKKGFSWGPPPESCWLSVKPHLKCLADGGSEASCSIKAPVSAECSPLVPELPLGAPQDCYCKVPTFFADYKGTPVVQEFRETEAECGPEKASFQVHCAILDDTCGTSCGCYEGSERVRDVYVEGVHDMSFRGRAWRACGFPTGNCQ
jgi:hypothetical protein